ncbi:MAG TPA: hypothetical protein VG734_14260 [Lacunisphaera sp.]|nr:hypothetical protein [Lacunisphaera sp.]
MVAPADPVTARQIPVIAQIIRDEIWLESERRGQPVGADDPVVRERVCEVVLRIGADMRRRLTAIEPDDDMCGIR